MSRAKKGAACEGQRPPQKEATESPFSIDQLLKAIEKMQESMDKKFQKLSNRIEALEPNQRSPVRNTGPREEKSGERDNHATKVGGQEITPPEQQSRQAASSSYEPSRFFQMDQPRQQPPPPPLSQPQQLQYHHSQSFSAPEPFLAGRQYQPIPSAVGEQAHRNDCWN